MLANERLMLAFMFGICLVLNMSLPLNNQLIFLQRSFGFKKCYVFFKIVCQTAFVHCFYNLCLASLCLVIFLICTNCSWCKLSQKKTLDVPPSGSEKGAIKIYWSYTVAGWTVFHTMTWCNWCFFPRMLCLFDVIWRVPCPYIELTLYLVILWMMFESMMYLNFRNQACLTAHY